MYIKCINFLQFCNGKTAYCLWRNLKLNNFKFKGVTIGMLFQDLLSKHRKYIFSYIQPFKVKNQKLILLKLRISFYLVLFSFTFYTYNWFWFLYARKTLKKLELAEKTVEDLPLPPSFTTNICRRNFLKKNWTPPPLLKNVHYVAFFKWTVLGSTKDNKVENDNFKMILNWIQFHL